MRVTLRDGTWADLRDHPTHGQVNVVRRALLKAGEEAEAGADVAKAYVEAYVTAWSVTGPDGATLPLERVEDAPDDVVQAIATEARTLFAGRPDPKGSTPPGRRSPLAQR